GKGNTPDDTWQFWFELAHARQAFHRLGLATATMSAEQRQKGIPGKVDGPIAGNLPNPDDTEGWIFSTDWDGGYEGFWGDRKANQVLAHPFVEKNSHLGVAITFRVPADGAYEVSGKVTDLAVIKNPTFTGILWFVDVVKERQGDRSPKADRLAGKGGPVGDGVGPESQEFKLENVALKKGELIRFVIDPNGHWGTDLTRVDYFRIKRVAAPAGAEQVIEVPSESFKKSLPATVVLPAGYDDPAAAGRKYPVLLLLHGADGGHADWPKALDLKALATKYERIIVAPTAGPNSWWVDHAGSTPNFGETFVTKELIAAIRAKYRISEAADHWITGNSTGGYGAMRIGLAHGELFSAVGGLSACMQPSKWGDKWGLNAAMGPPQERTDLLGPAQLKALAKKKAPILSIICGKRDSMFAKENRAGHQALEAEGVSHQWLDVDGEHNWAFWKTYLPKQLEYFQDQSRKAETP
ncbi:MAG: alpha/beta hydrolase, partial [Planctomycetota bacterium]